MPSLHHVQISLDVQDLRRGKEGNYKLNKRDDWCRCCAWRDTRCCFKGRRQFCDASLGEPGLPGGQHAPAFPVASSGADGRRWGRRSWPGPGLVLGDLGTTQFWKVNTPLCLHKPENRKNAKNENYSHWNLFTWADSSVWSFYLYTQDDFAEEFAFIGLDFIPTSFAGPSSNEYLRFLENRLVGLRTAHQNLTLGEISLEHPDHSFLLFLYTLDWYSSSIVL